jgi:hypothetical protein
MTSAAFADRLWNTRSIPTETGVQLMRAAVLFLVGLGIAAPTLVAEAQHRELGVHEHGRGTLNIAVEGARVTMELEVPGADIVGFEHAAKTNQQKAAVAKAKTQLMTPLSLFVLPAVAGCKVNDATVAIESSDHDHHKDPAKQTKGATKHAPDDDDRGHSKFRAQYALECASPSNLTAIDFAYFRTFAAAQKLDVNVITSKGQTKFEVTRTKPRIDLAGMM